MTVKELKEKLSNLPEEAAVIMYNGYAEQDCFCAKVYQTTKKKYHEYCQDDSFSQYVPEEIPIVVLSGSGGRKYTVSIE